MNNKQFIGTRAETQVKVEAANRLKHTQTQELEIFSIQITSNASLK